MTCLVANSIAFAKKVPLHPLHYFDFLDLQNTPFPHVIQANKREVMIRTQTQYTVSLRDVVDLDPDDYYGTADAIAF